MPTMARRPWLDPATCTEELEVHSRFMHRDRGIRHSCSVQCYAQADAASRSMATTRGRTGPCPANSPMSRNMHAPRFPAGHIADFQATVATTRGLLGRNKETAKPLAMSRRPIRSASSSPMLSG